MLVSDYDYNLPEELIAQEPLSERSASRMMRVNRSDRSITPGNFKAILNDLREGDYLVFNDTSVIPARIHGTKIVTGGKVEALLIEELEPGLWDALLKPGRRLNPGVQVDIVSSEESFEVISREEEVFRIRFSTNDVLPLLDQCGELPLPPYIQRQADKNDRHRYQTVYADKPGAVAAPTAGLHFTEDIIEAARQKGVGIAYVTLHVGLGTFLPVTAEKIEDHRMHEERYLLNEEVAKVLNDCRSNGGKIIAVGTTSVRVLESCVDDTGTIHPGIGRTRLFMHPPYSPKGVDGLLTNFHLPKSTLLMLVASFIGQDFMFEAYQKAIDEKFRFFSYGDSMLIPPIREEES